MALIQCPECGHSVSDKAISCPSCGYPISVLSTTTRQRKSKRRRKLPNGFGSIKRLSGKRSKPYAAYPPVTAFTLSGSPVAVPAIGYYEDYNDAYCALLEYKKSPLDLRNRNLTFSELYELYFESKYSNSKKELSEASKNSTRAAFKNCEALHNMKFADLRKSDLQQVIDTCPLKHSSLELIVSLFKGMYSYAIANDIIDKNYAQFVTINIQDDDEKGVPFSPDEIHTLWEHKDNETVGIILLLIYTGYRISAFKTIKLDWENEYFQGGVKTAAGKGRIVPIHPAIKDFAKQFESTYMSGGKNVFSPQKFRRDFYEALDGLNISTSISGTKHTPHDCRHTFSWLCDKYKIDEFTKHMLMGHSLGNDVEKSVYGHRTVDELREAVNKIKAPE